MYYFQRWTTTNNILGYDTWLVAIIKLVFLTGLLLEKSTQKTWVISDELIIVLALKRLDILHYVCDFMGSNGAQCLFSTEITYSKNRATCILFFITKKHKQTIDLYQSTKVLFYNNFFGLRHITQTFSICSLQVNSLHELHCALRLHRWHRSFTLLSVGPNSLWLPLLALPDRVLM